MLLVVENLLSKSEAAQARARLESSAWQDGRGTAGAVAQQVKHNQQLGEDDETAIALGNQILGKLGANPLFISAALPEKIYPPKFNRYIGGEHYGSHIDSAVMRVVRANMTVRADLSATLFLSEPDEYEGGILTVEGAYGVQEVKLAAGDMVLYPANSLHNVTPVTRGARLASFFWVQSMVADITQRAILFDLDQAIQALRAEGASSAQIVRLTGVYNNLLRSCAVV